MATLSKGNFRFNVILTQNVKADPEIHMKLQGTRTSKSILQMKKMQSQRTHTYTVPDFKAFKTYKLELSWRTLISRFQNLLQRNSNQD